MRVVLLVFIPLCWAQQAEDRVTVRDRMWMASKIYASILQYFGHWQAVPDLDLDSAYRRYLDQIAVSDDRMRFDLATMEFVACLRNGHSDFADPWLARNPHPLGFWLDLVDGKWPVRDPAIEGLEAGQIVTAIDGQPVDRFVGERTKYIAASEDRARRFKVFSYSFLWPDSVKLAFEGGRQVTVNRLQPKWKARVKPAEIRIPTGTVYHRIASFDDPKFENDAIEFVKANTGARLMVFDVRGNGGGSTPSALLRALIDRPYRGWMEASAMSFGLFATYGYLYRNLIPKDADARMRGNLESFSDYFERPVFMAPGPLHQPENPIYRGPVYVLQDRFCGSACEDFVMPLKMNGRATLFGERTFGSSGQPYLIRFENGMSFRVSSKRMYLPDGSEFEGVGIKPDVEVAASPDGSKDTVLAAALDAFAKR
jgi:carboxyl-terminal processing protease